MSTPGTTLAVIELYRRLHARLESRLRAFLIQYAKAEAEIVSLTLAGLAADKLSSLRERRKQVALARLILRAIDETTREEVPALVNQSFQLSNRVTELNLGSDRRGLSTINREAMKLLTENLIEDLHSATITVGRNVEDIFRKEALRAALENVPGERPFRQVTSELERTLRRGGITSFVDTLGRNWTLENYSKVAVKSVTQEAINISQANFLVQHEIDLVQINKSKNPCIKCLPFNGEIFSISGTSTKYPKLERRPSYHPLCEHFMFAAVEGLPVEIEEETQKEVVTA